MTEPLAEVYSALVASEAFEGSHVSLDRDRQGEEYVAVSPNWIDVGGLRLAAQLAATHDLALSLTRDGLRFESHGSATVRGVDRVKGVLRAEEGG